jgi:hypothetical protein
MSKAVHNAESGVEFVRANINDIVSDGIEKIDSDNLDLESENIKFEINIDDNSDYYEATSKGIYEVASGKEYIQKINFNIDFGLLGNLKNFNIKKQDNKKEDEHYKDAGGNLEDHISFNEWPSETFVSLAKIFLNPKFFDGDNFDNSDFNHIYENNDFNLSDIMDENNTIDSQNILIRNGNLIMESGGVNKKAPEVIKNSIIVVEGEFNINTNLEIDNSVIFVKDNLSHNGASRSDDWDNTLAFIYSENSNKHDYYLDFRGTGGFYVNSDDLPNDFVYSPEPEITNWSQL